MDVLPEMLNESLEGSHAKESLETSKSMPSILNP